MRRSSTFATAVLLVAALGTARPSAGQEIVPAVIGGAAGLAAGGYVAIGIWTAKARWSDDYLLAAADALGWETLPVLIGAGTGAAIGFADQDRLRQGVIGGTAGWFIGTGVGMTIGAEVWAPPEGRWAGGVIGGAAGLVLGAAIGTLWPKTDVEGSPDDASAAARAIPLGFTIRF